MGLRQISGSFSKSGSLSELGLGLGSLPVGDLGSNFYQYQVRDHD